MSKANALYKVFIKMSLDERREFIKLANNFINADDEEKQKLLNEVTMAKFANEILGPRGETCPVCGR